MASMAMAPGLSDVVQNQSGQIRLESMFIDEGFGSLDSESLDKAMAILAGLSEGKKLVGIISHVDQLRQRIDKKLIVEKSSRGSKVRQEL